MYYYDIVPFILRHSFTKYDKIFFYGDEQLGNEMVIKVMEFTKFPSGTNQIVRFAKEWV